MTDTQDLCQIKSYGDETVCHTCGLRWDTNDAYPPECGRTSPRPCPFCGKKPVWGLTKLRGCQMHGDPIQHVTLSCKEKKCPANPSVTGGDIYANGEGKFFQETKRRAREEAIERWNGK